MSWKTPSRVRTRRRPLPPLPAGAGTGERRVRLLSDPEQPGGAQTFADKTLGDSAQNDAEPAADAARKSNWNCARRVDDALDHALPPTAEANAA